MKSVFILSLCCFLAITISSQNSFQIPFDPIDKSEDYTDCAAIFINGALLVDKYSPSGICQIDGKATGELTVSLVYLNDDGATAVKDIEFQVGIKNLKTNTIRMFSNEVYKKIEVDDLLEDSLIGDNIIIMTTDRKISLTHNEILVMRGC